MRKDPDVSRILVDSKRIVKTCERIGKEISKDYKDKKPLLVGLLTGCVPFMAELIKHVTCDMEMDFIDVSSYDGVNSTGTVNVDKDITQDLSNRDIILVEDIVDTGITVAYVSNLLKQRKARSIEIATLLNKPEGRIVKNLNIKYSGIEIPNEFVIGFGLDYNGLYRNLPYVGVLAAKVYKKGD
ncbi:MAG: hypoxanthine phosphoribosyltransferase [Bacilli bacterium]|nr:hypoxanthine phosphoribosyltransferase [Bacilli bacterium]